MKHLKPSMESELMPAEIQNEEKPVVVMNGSLSTIYTKALNLAFAKNPDDGVIPEPTVESQAIDAAVMAAQTAQDQAEDGQGNDSIEISYSYNPNTSEDVEQTIVQKAVGQLVKAPTEFIFYNDETGPELAAGHPSEYGSSSKVLAIESVQIVVKLKKAQ